MIKATCTWGDGPDVMLTTEDKPYMLYDDPQMLEKATHGFSFKGSMDLTANEAEVLAGELLVAARQARELQRTCEDHNQIQQV